MAQRQQMLIERDPNTGAVEVKRNYPAGNRDLDYIMLGRAQEITLQEWMRQVYQLGPRQQMPKIEVPDGLYDEGQLRRGGAT